MPRPLWNRGKTKIAPSALPNSTKKDPGVAAASVKAAKKVAPKGPKLTKPTKGAR